MTLTFLTFLSFLITITLASLTAECHSKYCSHDSKPSRVVLSPSIPTPTLRLTNGERLARGLPIKPPMWRTRVFENPSPSSLPSTYLFRGIQRGIIQILDVDTGRSLGYISKNTYHAQYRYQPHRVDALIVKFTLNTGAKSACNVTITSENSDTPSFPLLALIQGRGNLNTDLLPNFHHFAYVGSADEALKSNSAMVGLNGIAKSNIWCFDTLSHELKLHYPGANQDGSRPVIHAFAQNTAIYIGQDAVAFNVKRSTSITTIKFLFVPI